MTFNFETQKLIAELKKLKPKKVLVQLPEGIKKHANQISKTIEKLGIKVVFSGETCWGGCAIAVQEAKALGVDLIIHFGHAKFIDVDFPVLYIEIKDELNLNSILKKSLKELEKYKTIGLSYSIQHRHDVNNIIKFYEEHGKKVILSKKSGYAAYEGHVLGCEYSGLRAIEKQIDCFVIIGNRFHSIGACLAVKKPVILIDVYNHKVCEVGGIRNKILKQRANSIQKLKDARNVGIITEEKIGQKFSSVELLAGKLKKQDKNVVIITMNEITPDKLMNFYDINCFIVLACPRIAIDDFAKYSKPIVTFKEALVALGESSWGDVMREGFL